MIIISSIYVCLMCSLDSLVPALRRGKCRNWSKHANVWEAGIQADVGGRLPELKGIRVLEVFYIKDKPLDFLNNIIKYMQIELALPLPPVFPTGRLKQCPGQKGSR